MHKDTNCSLNYEINTNTPKFKNSYKLFSTCEHNTVLAVQYI